MNKYIVNTVGLLLIPTLLTLIWALFQWGQAGKSMVVAGNNLSATIQSTGASVNNTLAAVNKPCAPGPCGLLANVTKTVTKVGDIAVTTQKQVAQTNMLVVSTSKSIQDVTKHIDSTLNVANSSLKQVNTDLQSADLVIKGLNPIEENANAEITEFRETNGDINSFLKSKLLNETEIHVGNIIANGDKMVAIGEQVEDKATSGYLHPSKNPFVRAWSVVQPYILAGAKVTANVF